MKMLQVVGLKRISSPSRLPEGTTWFRTSATLTAALAPESLPQAAAGVAVCDGAGVLPFSAGFAGEFAAGRFISALGSGTRIESTGLVKRVVQWFASLDRSRLDVIPQQLASLAKPPELRIDDKVGLPTTPS